MPGAAARRTTIQTKAKVTGRTGAPLLTGAGAPRVVLGAPADREVRLTLESVLSDEGFLMLRYRRAGDSGTE